MVSECLVDKQLLELVRQSVGSVWALELLLLLRQDEVRRWSEAELVAELRSSLLVVRQSRAGLRAGRLVDADSSGLVAYAPATPELAALVDQLGDEYRNRPDAVRRAIVAPVESKLKTFSDAFLWRMPKDD